MKKFFDFLNEESLWDFRLSEEPDEIKNIINDIMQTTKAVNCEFSTKNNWLKLFIRKSDLETNSKNLIKRFLDNYEEQIKKGNRDFEYEIEDLKEFREEYYQNKISLEKAAEFYFYTWDINKFADKFGVYWAAKETIFNNIKKVSKKYEKIFKEVTVSIYF